MWRLIFCLAFCSELALAQSLDFLDQAEAALSDAREDNRSTNVANASTTPEIAQTVSLSIASNALSDGIKGIQTRETVVLPTEAPAFEIIEAEPVSEPEVVQAASLSNLPKNIPTFVDSVAPQDNMLNVIDGIIDIPRHEKTGPVNGCSKIQKGLIMGGGFMVFTCEKLLPYYDISEHAPTFRDYKKSFKDNGWTSVKSDEPAPKKFSYAKTDAFGCEVVVDIQLWEDRSMNEPGINASDRNAHRQIVFKAWMRDEACKVHYDTVVQLAELPRF